MIHCLVVIRGMLLANNDLRELVIADTNIAGKALELLYH